MGNSQGSGAPKDIDGFYYDRHMGQWRDPDGEVCHSCTPENGFPARQHNLENVETRLPVAHEVTKTKHHRARRKYPGFRFHDDSPHPVGPHVLLPGQAGPERQWRHC